MYQAFEAFHKSCQALWYQLTQDTAGITVLIVIGAGIAVAVSLIFESNKENTKFRKWFEEYKYEDTNDSN